MCAAFTLPSLPLSLSEIYSEATSSFAMPSWLQTGGNARTSCQKLYELSQGLDFRLRFSINQIAENFSWVRSQLWTISQSIRDLLRHLAKLEILIAVLDSSLERLEQQVHQVLFQPMQARIKPKAKPRGSTDKVPSKKRTSSFRQRVASKKKSKELETIMARLEYLEQRDAQHDVLGRKFKAFAALPPRSRRSAGQTGDQGSQAESDLPEFREADEAERPSGRRGGHVERPAPLKWE